MLSKPLEFLAASVRVQEMTSSSVTDLRNIDCATLFLKYFLTEILLFKFLTALGSASTK
jgi:hypothetical protein